MSPPDEMSFPNKMSPPNETSPSNETSPPNDQPGFSFQTYRISKSCFLKHALNKDYPHFHWYLSGFLP